MLRYDRPRERTASARCGQCYACEATTEMHPATHLLISWSVAESAHLSPKDRMLVTLCGVLPDIDGLGIVVEIATENSARPLTWWSEYHHVLCHNIGFGLVLAGVVATVATRRWVSVALGLVAFHLHLLGDLAGSRGPDGYQWPIPYLLPFSNRWQLVWSGQWVLNAWPNVLITAALLGSTLYLAWRRGYSPVEMVSARADRAIVSALRARFGEPRGSQA